ncbi:SDR family NAD(P)-dependent oxidoreductase [Fibrella aquatilis]|uniref:SDR family NAD(P)-dependent oxidoreductase n=1 Tax=Fibrella aquatilis TaxID=2817059 RepID=A0A939JYP4_9BACT|nr:SDR family NAD(P)-dependent oxidoreductase [Fibrella aquatilis]MBO0932319.1 SDR family NAD(P)-dependent oxidoreductase [Fibrella aquatilis]
MNTVLVTGASGNLGQTLVEHLHQAGYDILATFQTERAARLFDHLPNVQTRLVDLLHEEAVDTFMASEPPARLRAAVLLVGGFTTGTLADTNLDQIQKLIQLNFVSAFTVVKALLPIFKQQGSGQFVLVGARPSLNADEGKNAVAYALSKALIFQLADLINADGAGDITASVVVPGILDTPANRTAMPDADPTQWVPTANLAELITFLLSDTGRMTRQTIVKLYNQS